MPLTFRCPHCGHETIVEDRFSGFRGLCIACRQPIEVPDFVSSSAPARLYGWLRWSGVALLIGVLIIWGISSLSRWVRGRFEVMQQTVATNRTLLNLQRITTALNEYAADYGSYPPPVTYDASGKPLHSWRVLLLPYLGEETLYSQLRLDEPWSASGNREALAASRPNVFSDPADPAAATTFSSPYLLVTGGGTMFPAPNLPAAQPQSAIVVSDGLENTILVVYCPEVPSTLTWDQPYDFDAPGSRLADFDRAANSPAPAIRLRPTLVATCAGQAYRLPASSSKEELSAYFTPAGGEVPGDLLLRSD
jgi:hypothetical protein